MKTNSHFPLLFTSIKGYLKRKQLLSFLWLTFLCIDISAQNTANIIIQPAATTATVGLPFTVNVRVDFTSAPATSSVDAVEVHLTFDKTKLQVASITKPASSVLPNEAIPLQSISLINTNGQINYAAFTLSSFPNADLDFLTITFNTIAGGGTSTPLTFLTSTPPNKTDAQRNGSSILVNPFVVNGTVNIQNCTPPTATIASTAASTTCNAQPVGLRLVSATGTGPYSLVVNSVPYTNVTVGSTFTASPIPFPSYKIWPSTNPGLTRQNDGGSIETGTKFRSTQAGFVKGVRFYSGSGTYTLGTYKGKLWNVSTGALLATVNYSGVTAGAWIEANFSTPVSIAANTTYMVTVFSSAGNYVASDNYFSSAVTSGPLTALANSTSTNGMYFFGSEQTGTTNFGSWQSFQSTNYWADVIFASNTNTFNLTSVTDNTGCVNSGALQTLNVTSVDCATLPITLLNLSASPNGRKVTLRWATSSEANNRGFDVQRSNDGVNWTTIGFVAGAGNSYATKNYTYLDDNLETRKYYYRLNQLDIDGRSKYSVIVSAVIGGKGEYVLGQNYPNPFRNETTIQYTIPQSVPVNISLFDISGRTVKVLVNASKEAGTHAISFNTGALTRGVYYYKIQAGDFTDVKKLTIQ
jgi:Domain of unknown function (DUF4082)/Secretion system C-terminal sorting domain